MADEYGLVVYSLCHIIIRWSCVCAFGVNDGSDVDLALDTYTLIGADSK